MMSAELEEQLASMVSTWRREHQPITVSEVTERRAAEPAPDSEADRTEVTVMPTPPRRRRVLLGVAAAAAIVATATAAGVVALGNRQPARDVADTVEPTAVSATATSIDGSPTSTTPTSATVVGVDPLIDPEREELLREIMARRAETEMVTGTLSWKYGGFADVPAGESTSEMVMRGDRSLWTTRQDGGWTTYDATTGLSYEATMQPDGSSKYMISNYGRFPFYVSFGYDPIVDLTDVLANPQATVDESTNGQLATWLISLEGADATDQWTVDQQTGIVAGYRREVNGGGTLELTISNLVVGGAFPDGFPNFIPADAVVEQSGQPDVVQTPESVAAQAGADFVFPADGFVRARVSPSFPGDVLAPFIGQSTAPDVELQLARTGFSNPTVGYSPAPSPAASPQSTVVFGFVAVDGRWCASADGVTCAAGADRSVVTDGALAGKPSLVVGTTAVVVNGSYLIRITARSADDALAIANSMQTPA